MSRKTGFSSDNQQSRRNFMRLSGGVTGAAMFGGLAGCIGDGGDDDAADDTPSDNNTGTGGGTQGTLTYGGLATVNAAGGWGPFEDEASWGADFVSISNSPGELLSTMLRGGGQQLYDLISPVGGAHEPLVENDVLVQPDLDRLENQDNNYNEYWQNDKGLNHVGYEGEVWGVPFIYQGDSMAYLPEETGEITSYGALFDDEFNGQVALEDNWDTAGRKTAAYLQESGEISLEGHPGDMTQNDITATIDFLIEQKNQGQFRTLWSGFETAVNLMANGEVVVMDTWEPVVYSLRSQDIEAEYANPDEGWLYWAFVNYIVSPQEDRSEERTQAIYDLIDFTLDGWYGAHVSVNTGYMTNKAAITYAEENDDVDAEEVQSVHDSVESKFQDDGFWSQKWVDNREHWDQEWQRFKNA